jgi:hypothetical protein
MKKIVILNIGGALSSYAEIDDKKIIIDLGKGSEFSPVNDFLIPLAKKRNFETANYTGNTDENASKYNIDQLFLSHLDNDHISDYEQFRNFFYPRYMTCPNNNETQDSDFKINTNYLTGENKTRELVLSDMRARSSETPNDYKMSPSDPLVSTIPEIIKLYYIKPTDCEKNDTLRSGYNNNISLVLFFCLKNKTLLMPGDISKEGMEYLIDDKGERNKYFKAHLNDLGIDFLVAPHHGLATSFSERLFREIKGNKTRLNIISEKIREKDSDENRSDVASRYYELNYSTGENSLQQNGVKTSMGHIVIDLETEETEVKQYIDIDDVFGEFIPKN